ncbi:hypothetical protein QBC42DRAFT_298551 [Cladorrhinum samala]|uniref:Uncharacterized protein n=1 Tax=Cladorrhinum samala TaxID=585594 RepID=A0AAV9HL85_9PEZI|nr:hypothetical protein QBC42DRAFT_298551 [Cladorrhinum samala]
MRIYTASTFFTLLGTASLCLAAQETASTPTSTLRTGTATNNIAQNLPTLVDDSGDPDMQPRYACMHSQGALSRGMPTQSAALSSWSSSLSRSAQSASLGTPLNSAGGPEAYCTSVWLPIRQAAPPASLSSEHASWKAEWTSWRESAGPAATSLASSCKTVQAETFAGLALLVVATDAPACATAMSVIYGGAQAQVTGVGKGNGNGNGNGGSGAAGSTASSAAGARETGRVIAAGVMAVVGVVGGVAML